MVPNNHYGGDSFPCIAQEYHNPLISFNPRAGRLFKLKPPHSVPQFTGKWRPRWGYLIAGHNPELGPSIPVPPPGALSIPWAPSLSTSPPTLSLPPRGIRTPSPTLVLTQMSAEAWMIPVKGLRVSKELYAAWVRKESAKEPKAVLACCLQAGPPTSLPVGCVCPHTHLG